MSLSKIYKHSAPAAAGAEQVRVESLSGAVRRYDPEELEKIGGDLHSIERKAYEEGFRAGEKAGFEFGRQKADVLFNSLSGILEELGAFKESLYGACEREMAGLCLTIAKKVIQREIETRSDTVLECVRTALKSVVAGGDITVRVNPKDLNVMRQYKDEISKYGDGIKGVHVEGDEAVSRGGCAIATNFGEIDATMESVMAEIEGKLANG